MRNLLVLAAALGLAGVANAQNSADVDQTGTSNSATASQSGGATLSVTQGTRLNQVTSTQVGASTAIVVQSSNTNPNTDGHVATLSQVGGDGNFISLSQSFGTPRPQGNHTATISQDGNDNVVAGDTDGTSYDPAEQESRSDRRATVNQTGDRNRLNFADGADLTVDQDGADNYAETRGGGRVDIDQIGTFNDAYSLGANTSTIYQEGDRNEARVRGGFAGSRHDVDISQVGSDNVARANGDPRGGSTAVDQDGDFNSATMDYGNPSNRDASGVDYDVTQDAGAFGAMGASNSFDATVRGEDNTATVRQTLTAAGMNSIVLQQLSDGNAATLTQTGVGNTATVTQQ